IIFEITVFLIIPTGESVPPNWRKRPLVTMPRKRPLHIPRLLQVLAEDLVACLWRVNEGLNDRMSEWGRLMGESLRDKYLRQPPCPLGTPPPNKSGQAQLRRGVC